MVDVWRSSSLVAIKFFVTYFIRQCRIATATESGNVLLWNLTSERCVNLMLLFAVKPFHGDFIVPFNESYEHRNARRFGKRAAARTYVHDRV